MAAQLVVFAAALTAGVTGFGFVVLSAPLLAFFMPPAQVVPLTVALGCCLMTARLAEPGVWRGIDWRLTLRVILAGALGIPLGAALLARLDAGSLRLLVGLVVLASVPAALLRFAARPTSATSAAPAAPAAPAASATSTQVAPVGRRWTWSSYGAGFVSGVLSGAVGMNGPPVALYLVATDASKEVFRSTMVATVWLFSTLTLLQFAVAGQLPSGLALQGVTLLPALAAGGALGCWRVQRLSVRTIQLASLAVAGAAGASTAIRGLLGS